MRATESILVRKERLNPASILKNNLKIDKTIELTNARFNTTRKSLAFKPKKGKTKITSSFVTVGAGTADPFFFLFTNVITKNASRVTVLKEGFNSLNQTESRL